MPAFDPTITVKRALLSGSQVHALNRGLAMLGQYPIVGFVVGYLLRVSAMFCPAPAGRILAPIAPLLQLPGLIMALTAFRFEFMKILARHFEFSFLVFSTTIWTVCFAIYFSDLRVLLLPTYWLEFVCVVLVETYFRYPTFIAMLSAVSSCFLLALTFCVSANVIDDVHRIELYAGAKQSLTSKDILVNSMTTVLTLMVRLAYRKLSILRDHSRDPTSTWTPSIGYRCRIKLQPVQVVPRSSRREADWRPTSRSPAQIAPFELGSHAKNLPAATQATSATPKLLQMRFIENSGTFDPRNTLIPLLTLSEPLKKWQMLLLYGTGAMGLALSGFAIHPASDAYPETLKFSAVLGLAATVVFVAPFVGGSQRQLLTKLHYSFDFLFIYLHHLSAHVCLCDVLSWEWRHCCAVISSTVWTHWMLSLDALTPMMKARLGMRTEYAIPALVAKMALKVVYTSEMLILNRYNLQNRLFFDHMIFGRKIQFYVIPFLFSRMVTVFIWCGRILYRILTRKHPDEMVIILGNVEYNYAQWKKDQQPTLFAVDHAPLRQRHSSSMFSVLNKNGGGWNMRHSSSMFSVLNKNGDGWSMRNPKSHA